MENSTPDNNGTRGINHVIYALALAVIGIVIYFLFSGINENSLDTVAVMLFRKTLTLAVGIIFTWYWKSKYFDADNEISRKPVATAIYLGCWAIALGVA